VHFRKICPPGVLPEWLLVPFLGLALISRPVAGQHSAVLLDALAADLPAATTPSLSPLDSDFTRAQLRYPRVLRARVDARFNVKRAFHERGIAYPAAEIYLRAFKRERALELWVRPHGEGTFSLLKIYDICAMSGELGPKKRQGDRQVPEGYYEIDFFNPSSDYLLSLHVDYPNDVDRTRPGRGGNLGGDIYIHGGCESIGCLAVTDEGIKELYWISVEARAAGQNRIPIHIFPARLTDQGLDALRTAYSDDPALTTFWGNLKPGFDFFEQTRRVPRMLRGGGQYRVADLGPGGEPARLAGKAVDSSPPATRVSARPAPLPIRRGPPQLRGSPVVVEQMAPPADSAGIRTPRLRGTPVVADTVRAGGSGTGGGG
jgi:murein L,D-transpeptidase YafK